MRIDEALATKLNSTTAVNALVAGRIYPFRVRKANKTYPLIIYRFSRNRPCRTSAGPGNARFVQLELACVAASLADADTLADAVETALDGTRFSTWGTVTVQGCDLPEEEGIDDDQITDPSTEEIALYVKNFTFQITYFK